MLTKSKSRDELNNAANSLAEFKNQYRNARNSSRQNLEAFNTENEYRFLTKGNLFSDSNPRDNKVALILNTLFNEGMKMSSNGNALIPTNSQDQVIDSWLKPYFSASDQLKYSKSQLDSMSNDRPTLFEMYNNLCEKLESNHSLISCENTDFAVSSRHAIGPNKEVLDYMYINFKKLVNINSNDILSAFNDI